MEEEKIINTPRPLFKNKYVSSILLMLLVIGIGFVSLACTGTKIFQWNIDLPLKINFWLLPFAFLTTFFLFGNSILVMWLEKISHPETKYNNLIMFLIALSVFTLWPMFLVLFELPIVAVCIISACTLFFVYLTYRFLTNSLWSGILFAIGTAISILLMIYNYWYIFAS